MSETTLNATARTEFGKGAARRVRRAGNIPAVLYGHGTDPVHLTLPAHDTFLAIKGRANALVTIAVGGKEQLALVKDVQREPVRAVIEHIDLILVRKGEKVTVEVPVALVGASAAETIAALDMQTVTLVSDATSIPERIEVSVEGAEAGTVIRAGELSLPAGSSLEVDPETVVVAITVPRAEEEAEAEEGVELAEGFEAPEAAEESAEAEEGAEA